MGEHMQPALWPDAPANPAQSLTIEMPDGRASVLTVDEITTDRAVVRSTMDGEPDETDVLERRAAGTHHGKPFGLVAWRHRGTAMTLADWRVREWLEAMRGDQEVNDG
jgi:hypothetical protein